MCHEKITSRKRGEDLQKTNFVFSSSPNNLYMLLKLKANKVLIKLMDRKILSRKIIVRSLERTVWILLWL